MRDLANVVIAAIGALVFAATGATADYSSRWYANLRKPSWVTFQRFIPFIWALTYAAATASAILTWQRVREGATRTSILSLLGVNALLNFLFSVIFTRRRDLQGAVVDSAAIVGTSAAVLAQQWLAVRSAALLNLPYVLWTSFAAYLTWLIYRLNRGAQA